MVNNSFNQQINPDSANYCFGAYPASFPQEFSFSVTQPSQLGATMAEETQRNRSKSSELKFKIESVGTHPEDDDDLDMCPARTRACWPKQIIPWWVPSEPNEKPPYSYATLISHAILSSKDGRLTLNDIYTWIAKNYPAFSVGQGGWQNSIRHNLSLNKKWFCKMERRPTQANPGKGCYWTLVSGTEHVFIDNLTQECGHSRKHHDIGLTAELSVGHRRGVCYYRNNSTTTASSDSNNISRVSYSQQSDDGCMDSISFTPPSTPSKPDRARSLSSPLYITFRMTPSKSSTADDSDNDSGVDVSHEYIDRKLSRKRRRTTKSCSENNVELIADSVNYDEQQKLQQAEHVNTSMVHDTPTSSIVTSFGLMPDSSMKFEINNWIENSLLHSELYDNKDTLIYSLDFQQEQWRPDSPLLSDQQQESNWCDSTLPSSISTFGINTKKSPITIHLDDVTQTYLHFEEEESNQETMLSFDNTPNYISLYPDYDYPQPIINNINTSFLSPSLTTNIISILPSHLQQFVSMQDILYS